MYRVINNNALSPLEFNEKNLIFVFCLPPTYFFIRNTSFEDMQTCIAELMSFTGNDTLFSLLIMEVEGDEIAITIETSEFSVVFYICSPVCRLTKIRIHLENMGFAT